MLSGYASCLQQVITAKGCSIRDHTKSGALGEVSPAVLTGWHVTLLWPDRKTGDGLQGVQPASRQKPLPPIPGETTKNERHQPTPLAPPVPEDDEEEEVVVALYDFSAMEPQDLSLFQ
ncbi:uncharacterized protein KZ484_019011 [Pholidichthys leucotaenia]